ncbi:enoyl-CoA hydratase-isomerase [Candidatus Filomicrobium marinum]|uniref:Enoyl-CoA hydratase-isomerase n=2 Tax=Filomicrobium TaxID=119044 RepID=A0A0D6JBM4_9HYPH|nr:MULTISPECIES: enoyl-CoA hydratase-related protein [Filomicrobium]MCV0370690.1 enoyl-CoA hydratase/isomerase family protein [Filomicrobium sp.]CFX06520.1 enoyl-CoA hydratase-isomerase [Candidatus Filomicrobium marinum]CPR16446.1 enoyl-CoA hydratase-isomerase [Candidatus Filomicrobium marinum]SDP56329.1 short chain enoyl-CoA hydratase [Filomicrobium insigne]
MALVLREEPSEGVKLLRLNRPDARNALNTALRKELASHFQELSSDETARCIVITGDDKAFAAGADLKEIVDDTPVEIMNRNVRRFWNVISSCPVPVIAAVRGVALGGGCELALHADIIVAGENARFAQPEVCVGVMPGGGGTQRLVRAIGKYQTMKLVLTGEPISGRDAFTMGLASEVVPDDAVLDRALEMARKIASLPPISIRLTKEVTLAGADAALDTGLLMERRLFEMMFATADQKEGMNAFIEKRKPDFAGR